MKIIKISSDSNEKFYRYIYKDDGTGLCNRNSWDLSKLTEDEEMTLVEELTYGLENPRYVDKEAIFAFTSEGRKKHEEIINLLIKASNKGDVIIEELDPDDYDIVWESNDGQVALMKNS